MKKKGGVFALYKLFEKICLKSFHFLSDEFGFKHVKTETDIYSCVITYKNKTTAIEISLEQYNMPGVWVLIYRLIDGEIPEYAAVTRPETVINSFYLPDIVSLRSSSSISDKEIKDILHPKRKELEVVLEKYAKSLKKYAPDILQGDFKIFPQLEKIVKK